MGDVMLLSKCNGRFHVLQCKMELVMACHDANDFTLY